MKYLQINIQLYLVLSSYWCLNFYRLAALIYASDIKIKLVNNYIKIASSVPYTIVKIKAILFKLLIFAPINSV